MIEKKPRHRPERHFNDAKRIVVKCERELCIHCNTKLVSLPSWHMRKTIQTLSGAVFVAGKGKECANSECEYFRKHYYASGVLKYSLQRRRLALNEAPRQQKRRLHRNPVSTIQALVNQHTELRTVLEFQALKY